MKLKKIILEGDSKYEKVNQLFPIRWKSHHVTELFMELLPEIELDGNKQLTILATRNRRENAKKYNNYKAFNASSYYLEEEQIKTLELLKNPEDVERFVLGIIEEVLVDIINIVGEDEEKISAIKDTTKKVMESEFSLKKKINTLSKKSKIGKYKADVFRCLNRVFGEVWCVELENGLSGKTRVEWLTSKPDYLDRRDYFKKSKWEENKFIITNKLCIEVSSIESGKE
ncbi:hypothetical protein [Paenibacillus xylanexedens]|uniref:hypothetical protein n=1 Tax=Paenibacillus xylanexedens TaxID=528191 RepID=UPI0011AA5032|nr:hypothetical protein [Paenibacillus xylanexedens]